jgi:coenzyme F420-dependent glucose-6-phosphate dehydrogenase
MIEIGYALSSEEHPPADLIDHARLAEDAGFTFALISDHFHPWIGRQGQSPFVWTVLGGIARATHRLVVGTGVTCPTIRIHPAIIAQAAATTAALMPNRFFLGLGTGENLNEHVVGAGWPPLDVRTEMLEEAVDVIRQLWTGEQVNHRGDHFTVENARLYSLPDRLPPIYLAAGGEKAARQAARLSDGLIGTGPETSLVSAYEQAGGRGPRFAQVTVCWAESEASAERTAREWWPTVAVHGEATQELPLPAHFEQLAEGVTDAQVAKVVPCGPDPERHLAKIREYLDAGFDRVYLHQVGPDQRGFIEFAKREILPALKPAAARQRNVAAGRAGP